jgi:hypothetical protein
MDVKTVVDSLISTGPISLLLFYLLLQERKATRETQEKLIKSLETYAHVSVATRETLADFASAAVKENNPTTRRGDMLSWLFGRRLERERSAQIDANLRRIDEIAKSFKGAVNTNTLRFRLEEVTQRGLKVIRDGDEHE